MSEKQAILPDLDETFKQENAYALTLESGAQYSITSLKAEVKSRERQLLTLLQSLEDAGIEVKDGRVVSPWISAEHKKPQAGQDILFEVPSCYGVEKGMFHPDLREPWMSDRTSPYNDLVHFSNQEVTRWMPLPVPPTDSTKEVK